MSSRASFLVSVIPGTCRDQLYIDDGASIWSDVGSIVPGSIWELGELLRGEGAAASVESDSYRPVVASALVERWEHEGPQVAVNVVLSGGRGGGKRLRD